VELFAATSFGRIMTRRTSMTGAFSAPRMRTPRGPSRTLWSLHRIESTSDVPLSPAGTPESESFPPDVLSYRQRVDLTASRGLRGVDLLVRGPCFALVVETKTGNSPRTPSVVLETCELSPTSGVLRKLFRLFQPARTVSPSVHPRPCVRRCYGFLPG
jgi:hypothetical protein